VTFLLAEQNTNMALRYADYGYILENGRVVMEGAARPRLANNEDVKEFYLGRLARDPRPRRARGRADGSAAGAGAGRACHAGLCPAAGGASIRSPSTARTALAKLPVTRKSELLERQKAGRADAAAWDPFGGFSAIGWRAMGTARLARRVYQSPGPIYEPEGHGSDYWRCGRAMFAAGFRAGDLAHNSFSYHLTPGAWIMESGAHAVGCTVFPGGVGNTEMQLQAAVELRADGYIGTPSFLRILLEKANADRVALPHLRKALLGGEAFPPALRDWLAERGVAGVPVLCHRRRRPHRLRDPRPRGSRRSTRA
jgi:phenylacetate-CoA ligase